MERSKWEGHRQLIALSWAWRRFIVTIGLPRLARRLGLRKPSPPLEPLALWAFWPYGRFPYLLSGRVVEQLEDGRVKVEGYTGMVFRPVFLSSGAAGERLHREVKRVAAAYQIHEECARNGAGQVAHEHLLAAGLPPGALMKLQRSGWQGEAYRNLFRRQLAGER